MRKSFIAVGTAALSLLVLTGCQGLNGSSSFKLAPAAQYQPHALSSLDEQQFENGDIASDFKEWTKDIGWSKTYELANSPITFIPKNQNESFGGSASHNACTAWVPSTPGSEASSTTFDYVYRLKSAEGKAANATEVADVITHLDGDMQRQGWKTYNVSHLGFTSGSAGQKAWYAPSTDIDSPSPTPVKGHLEAISGKPNSEYISYRVLAADRGNGYISLYVTTPCAPVESDSYSQLQGDVGSAELDLIQSDSKNPDNAVTAQ